MRSLSLKSNSNRLFLISFIIFFLELVCIRWLSSYILYLGYFTNFVLLGCLLGIGAGTLLARRSYRLIKWLPFSLFFFFTTILFTRAQVNPHFKDFIYFTSTVATFQLPAYVLLPIIFIGVTIIFTILSQDLGFLLTEFAPLKAYNLNILGSLTGIALFALMGILTVPSWVWFLVTAVLLIPMLPSEKSFGINIIFLVGMVLVIFASDFTFANIWSPYYRLNVFEKMADRFQLVRSAQTAKRGTQYKLLANGAGHQEFTTLGLNEPFYELPYVAFKEKPNYQTVLVIGAGGGNDVAVALAHGVEHIDAVEIDPIIVDLGKRYHPESPYSNKSVTLNIDDARSFLEKTDEKYDLIIYALPDSLVLASNTSNIRLESYLFTIEAFQSVKDHLKPDGLFVLYNYYRFDWLIMKISNMLYEVFGEPPVYHRYSTPVYEAVAFATIFVGSKTKELDLTYSGFFEMPSDEFALATDDWPFLYLKGPYLPEFYSGILIGMLVFSGGFIWKISPKRSLIQHGWPFFFMGAAFTLLEAKSIVHFFLLFGSTWLVNSLVFFAILCVVLIANLLAARYRFSKMWVLYCLLMFTLVINFLIPLKTFLTLDLAVRYITVTAFLFSPIFFANLIFSTAFRETKLANIAFGANLLGTLVGGTAEYLSLITGYRALSIVVAFFYLIAFFTFRRMRRK